MLTFLILKVHREKGHFLVTRLHIRRMRPGDQPEWVSRAKVLHQIKCELASYYTLPPDGHGSTEFGPKVRLFSINGEHYMRVGDDAWPEDDLGAVPEEFAT